MKKHLLTIFMVAVTLQILSAQTPPDEKKPQTKIEILLLKKGKLLIKDFFEQGKIEARFSTEIEITAVVISSPGEQTEKTKGLKIEISKQESYGKKDNSAFLDIEEIQSLIKAMDYLLNLSLQYEKENREYTEVVFSTLGDFKIGFYQTGNKQGYYSSAGSIGSVTAYLNSKEDFIKIKDIVTKGLSILNQK